MSIRATLQKLFSTLVMLINTWILRRHTAAIYEHEQAVQNLQTTTDDITHAGSVTELIDNINKN